MTAFMLRQTQHEGLWICLILSLSKDEAFATASMENRR